MQLSYASDPLTSQNIMLVIKMQTVLVKLKAKINTSHAALFNVLTINLKVNVGNENHLSVTCSYTRGDISCLTDLDVL